MSNPHNILVIDDELQIRKLLRISLETENYRVTEADTGSMGLSLAENQRPNLIVLDLGLPDLDGTIVLKKLREITKIPIIILSVRNSEKDIVEALENGADDYITKPFYPGELIARIKTAIRHSIPEQTSPVLIAGKIRIDINNRIVFLNDEEVKLTVTEYELLVLFVKNSGKVLTHQYILKEVWGRVFADETQYLRVYVSQLRKKFEKDPAHPTIFTTESGIGYRMVVAE